jgi:hypothetical protein
MKNQPENNTPQITNQIPHATIPALKGKSLKSIHIAIALIIILIIAVGTALAVKKKTRKTSSKNPSVLKIMPSPTPTLENILPTPTETKLKITVAEEGTLILPKGHADPTVIKTTTGFRMYVNRQSGGPNGILIFNSTDGVEWKKEKDIVIPGASTSRVVATATGVRLYYPQPQPIRSTDPIANMISSSSKDGLTFTKDTGIVLAPRSKEYYVEGPTVFQLPDKSWRMYFNENTVAAAMQRDGEIWGASSPDGVTWTRDEKVTMQADEVESDKIQAPWKQLLHPFVLSNPKGGYIMFYNSHSELFAATSTDGLTWEKIGDIGIHGADIDGYFQDDGTIRVFYGDFNPKDGGLVYSAVLKVK